MIDLVYVLLNFDKTETICFATTVMKVKINFSIQYEMPIIKMIIFFSPKELKGLRTFGVKDGSPSKDLFEMC